MSWRKLPHLGQRRDADARTELVSERNALHLSAVFVVGDVQRHGGGVHVVEVVEAVPGVAAARGDVAQIAEASSQGRFEVARHTSTFVRIVETDDGDATHEACTRTRRARQ